MNRDEIIRILKDYKARNKYKYHIQSLGIFGSVAKNCMHDDSDVDIVVKLTRQDLFELIGIKQDLEELLAYRVDVVSYREKMNAFLKKRIDAEAIYV